LEWLGGPSLLKEALLFRGPNGERFTIEKSNPLGGTVTIHIHCEGSVVSNGETVRFPIEIQLPYYTYKRETPHEEYKLSMLDFLMEQAEIGLLSHTGDVNKVITEIFNLILPSGNSEVEIFDIVAFNSSVAATKTTLTFGNPILGTADSVYVLDVEKKGSNKVILTLQKESGGRGSAGTSDVRQIEMVFQIHDSGKKSISIDVDKTSEASSRLIDGKTTIVSKQECRIIERGSGQFDIEVRKGSTLSVYRLEKNECIFVPEGCTTIKSTEKSGEMRDALYSLHALLSNMTMINHPYTMFGDKHAMDSLFISGFVDFASSDLPLVVTSKGPMDDQTRIELSIVTRMRQARCYTSSSGYQRDLAYLKAAKQARDENRR
jgi:hypothetical protein